MAECNHECNSCGQECGERNTPQSFQVALHKKSKVKKVIGVVSGKGGVGKSLITSLLACSLQRSGNRVAIMDADITGPSIPKCFAIHEIAQVEEDALLPAVTTSGIQMMSINLLLEDETEPVIFRGPVIAGTVKQFWSEVIWTDVDVMLVDMPPGTGDVPLTVFQSLPVDGIVIVASPQELVGMIVEKAVKMARDMDIPILGMVENMAYYVCPDCGKKHAIFGESHLEEIAAQYGIENLARIPIDSRIATACDHGKIEDLAEDWLDAFAQKM